MGALPGVCDREFHETCGLFHLYRVVEATLAIHRCHEAHDRPLLALSTNGAALAKCSNRSIEEKRMVFILNACMNACMCGRCECVRMDV